MRRAPHNFVPPGHGELSFPPARWMAYIRASFMSGDFLRESMAVAAPVPARPPARISYADFLEPAGEGEPVEWFEGKVLEMSPVTDWRADSNDFLYSLPDSLTRRELMLPQS